MQNLYWDQKAYEIAEKGIFNKEGLTPLESVYSTNVYEVFKFISLDTAKDTLRAELTEMSHKDAMNKSKKRR